MKTSGLTFVFDRFVLTDEKLDFFYSYQDGNDKAVKEFKETFHLPFAVNANDPLIRYVLQQLHIIVGISYYKSLLGDIKMPYELDDSQCSYWNTVYDHGLGELSYVNKIKSPITPFRPTATTKRQPTKLNTSGAILGVGGGKDSIVAGELMRRIDVDTTTLDIATRDNRGQAGKVMQIIGFDELTFNRYLDTSIVAFTKDNDGYNGHVPLSAMLAWLGVLVACAKNKRFVLMANEAASSVGNTVWNGKTVNHQWSKSIEFEKLTQDYIQQNVSPDIWYCSPIRPYSSLAVIKLFSKWGDRYQDEFTSCNNVLRIDPNERPNGKWCGNCAKCLSTWLLLSVWLPIDRLDQIFSKKMLKDVSMKPVLQELLGLVGHKPLDCVGTTEELRAATRQALEKHSDSPLFSDIKPAGIPGPSIKELIIELGPHNIPEELSQKILPTVAKNLE